MLPPPSPLPPLEELAAAVDRCWALARRPQVQQEAIAALPEPTAALVRPLLQGRAAVADRLPPELATRCLVDPQGARYLTSWPAARYRALRLAAAGMSSLGELACGVGGQLLAAASVGLSVRGVEADPLRAALARYNLGLAGATTAEVRRGDVADPALLQWLVAGCDVLLLDAARPAAETQRSIASLQPAPLPLLAAVRAATAPGTTAPPLVLELPPFIEPDIADLQGWEWEYLGTGESLGRLSTYPPPLAQAPRSAVLVDSQGQVRTRVTGTAAAPQRTQTPPAQEQPTWWPTLPWVGLLHPALVRSGLSALALPSLAQDGAAWQALGWSAQHIPPPGTERRAPIAAAVPLPSPWVVGWMRVQRPVAIDLPLGQWQDAVVPLRRALQLLGAGKVTLRVALSPEQSQGLHQALAKGLGGGRPAVVIELQGRWWVALPLAGGRTYSSSPWA